MVVVGTGVVAVDPGEDLDFGDVGLTVEPVVEAVLGGDV